MRFLRMATRVLVVAAVLGTVYLAVTFVQVWRASTTDRAAVSDAIVVLGAAQYDGAPSPVLRSRLDHAIELREQGIADVIVVTGGNQPGDRTTEATASADYLMARGVPDGSIRREVSGTNSWQSLAAAARFLQDEDLLDVVLVSSPHHALRTEAIAEEVGLRGRASPAARSSEGLAAQVTILGREAVAVGVGRIIGFGRLVDRVGRVRGAPATG
ncbi:MAG: YdcF family protein [Actinomycetota bacterium]|nr:YdcF family protein [Actinomycetota bacterium]